MTTKLAIDADAEKRWRQQLEKFPASDSAESKREPVRPGVYATLTLNGKLLLRNTESIRSLACAVYEFGGFDLIAHRGDGTWLSVSPEPLAPWQWWRPKLWLDLIQGANL